MKTLVVEDDMMSQCLLAKVLTERGHEVVSYENAEQAILAYQKEFYPLLFVDAGLPGMDGLQFCKWVRSQPNGDKVFVMIATAPGHPPDMNEVLTAGANDFLPKPYAIESLAVRLTVAERQMNSFFERKELEDSLRQSQEGFHRVVKAVHEGAWLLNAQFRTDYVNPQMAIMIGYPVEELANRPVVDFLPDTAQADAEQVFTRQREGKAVKTEFRFRRKDGSECVTMLSAAPVHTESGEFKGSLWMVADLTEKMAIEAELEDARTTLEARVRELSSDLSKTTKSLQKEQAGRKEAEQAIKGVRAELEARMRDHADERAKLADQLKVEIAGRHKVEEQLIKARDESTAQVTELTEELNKSKAALQAEVGRRQEGEETLRKQREELESRLQQQAIALVKTEKALQEENNERQRLAESLDKARCELEVRDKELTARLVQAGDELKQEGKERKRMEEELAKAREDFSRRVRDHMTEMLKASDELKAVLEERKKSEAVLVREREEAELKFNEHTEEIRRCGAEHFQLLARATNDVVRDWDLQKREIQWNGALLALFGYKPEDMEPGMESWQSRIHPEDKGRVLAGIESFLKSDGESWTDEYRFRKQDNSYTHVSDRGYLVRDETRQPVRLISAMEDASHWKHAEAAMIEGQARKGAILEAALDAIVTIDHEGKIFEWNPAAEKMFGHRRGEVLGKDLAELIIPPSLREKHRAALAGLLNTDATMGRRMELNARRADGTEFPVEMAITRIATDGPPVFTGFIRDVTDRLNLESQLRQAQKMESIGQLAAGVAHDFNNLLSVVHGYSALLLEEKELKPEVTEALKQISSATERASHLTRQLLTFSRKQIIHARTLDLNEVLNNVGKLLNRVIGEGISLQFNYSPGLPPVEVDAGMIEQVVMNLAINARDAMPQGGQLTVGTRAIEIGAEYAQRNREARPGRFVCLSVSDTGCGMDEATVARIFEPFFTTKTAGKGTGLGLATVYGIVKQHQGWIEVQSQIGRGTTFNLYLPASTKAITPPVDSGSKPPSRGGTETVLLVEDEPAVLMMATGILQRLGYKVLSAESGDDAMVVWQQQAPNIDLLLTDMVMPGSLNGRELADKLLQDKQSLKVVYTSGYSMELVGPGLATSKNFVFLQKPYHPETLAQTLRNCLDGKLT